MPEIFAKVLLAGLNIWESKEKTKYIDHLMDIQRRRYEEQNKPAAERSDAVLDQLEFELRILGIAFAAGASQPVAPNQP